MHIKSIILDGFKSYRDRTEIGHFDPHFNAITGLNGSGKSNILDAICFVLGLSSMQVVRAANLNELVYKGGAGGVNRASASIVFDNTDKRKSPAGYEKYDEIIVSRSVEASGSCKYHLNSVTSTKKQITDLFESVQLNMSNPNFLIMQGKITKVIGYGPKQILAMIEETVGGNVYQGKRDKTEQEIKNKDRILDLVRETINDDILPEWRRQRGARDKLQEFQTLKFQAERAMKNYAILRFHDLDALLQRSKDEFENVTKLEQNDQEAMESHKREISNHKKLQERMKKENEEKYKGKIDEAEKVLNAEKKRYKTVEAKMDAGKMDVEDSKNKLKEFEKVLKETEKEYADYKTKSSNSVNEFERVKKEIENAQMELAKAKEQENALKLGNIVDDEGKTCDARQELMRVQEEIHKIQPDYQVGAQQYKEDMMKLEAMQKELKKTPTNAQVERDFKAKQDRFEKLKADAVRRNINPDDSPGEIVKTLNASKGKLQQLQQEKDGIIGRHHYLSLSYEKRDHVDATKIHGCVYELVKFNKPEEWGSGMEVLAGGILGHIVVEDQNTGKSLLNAGLSRRTNIHPVVGFHTSNTRRVTQQELDRKLGQGKAVPAIDLIECNQRYKDIIQHFFGGKVLCDTLETAKKVAFGLGYYAVSKLGDVADPDGIMQGGSRKNLGELIRTCERLRSISQEIKQIRLAVDDMNKRLNTAKSNEDFMKQLEIAKRDLQNVEETRKLTSYSLLQKDIGELQEKLQKDEESLKSSKEILDKLEASKKSWTAKVNQLEQLREKGRKENAAQIVKWEKALESAKKKYDSKQKQFGEVDLELKSREALLEDCQKDINKAMDEIAEYEEKMKRISADCETAKGLYDNVQKQYDQAIAESNKWNSEYKQLENEIVNLENAIHLIEVAKIKRGNAREKLEETVKRCENELDRLKKENRTIVFANETIPPGVSLNQAKAEYESLKKQFDSAKERIDVNAAEQFGSTKDLLKTAQGRLKTVEENKQGLNYTITKLDEIKMNIVQDAYSRVNEEFSKMMSTLLPESAARLVAVNSEDLSQGLNIHVQLGGVWKESLSELSGGQRSLVALALVLSLCMYNPAPFYILDEIDAALDLNHTQNVGVLIKKRFTDTQFVCVSLKDGMYSNCNILFQVQFSNGKSEVKRCVRQKSKRAIDDRSHHQTPASRRN